MELRLREQLLFGKGKKWKAAGRLDARLVSARRGRADHRRSPARFVDE
jgi:hypothetical protein